MADSLYLSLWFPSFSESEMLPKLLCVLRHFPSPPNGRESATWLCIPSRGTSR